MNAPASRWALSELQRRMKPRQRLTVSQWADAHRVLSPKASSEPGRWRTERTPYLREIMDSLSADSPVERVVVMKSAQLGVTELAVNWIGYIMGHLRSAKPTLIVLPTEKLLVRWQHQRLRPMLEGTAELRALIDVTRSREGSNRLDLLDYPGGLLYLTTAGSAPNLKSDSICYVICDEADEYDWDTGGRGDPLGLIESRQSNFPRRKLLIFSTPTVRGSSRIEGEWLGSDQRRYEIACPHCGAWQPLVWEHLGWTSDLGQVWYSCAEAGCVIEERDKPAMLAGGRWVATRPEIARVRGYHLNALYAPLWLGYSWRQLVEQWIGAQESEERQQQFRNERLGLSWEDQRTATRADDIAHRAESWPVRVIQPGVGLLTAGIDTQDNRLAVQVIGWGRGGRWWVIDYHEIPGDLDRPEPWATLAEYLARPMATAHGVPAQIEAVCHDMGGHYTDRVKQWTAGAIVPVRHIPRLMAVIGSRFRRREVLGKPRKTDFTAHGKTLRHGAHYHEVGTETAKDRLFRDLRQDADREPAERSANFSRDLPPEYFEGLVSETWNPKRQRYEPRRGMTRRNEPLDTWVYAYAAAHHPHLRLDKLRDIDWDAREARLSAEVADDSTASQERQDPEQQRLQAVVQPPRPRRGGNYVSGWRR
jgi:phage terminase large subunit GpA-like protein